MSYCDFCIEKCANPECTLTPRRKMEIKIKKLNPEAVIPKYAKSGDAGMDLTAIGFEFLEDEKKVVYSTGLAIEIPKGYVGYIFPRSSIHKTSMRLSNCVGVIDSGYRGEIKFVFDYPIVEEHGYYDSVMKNTLYTGNEYSIGDRIGQLIIMPYPEVTFVEVDTLSETERGDGGFGSSGV